MRDLNVPAYISAAYGVNDAGVVVGNVTSPQPEIGGYLWTEASGVVRLERPMGGALAVNRSGQVAGGATINDVSAAALWTPSINNAGIVVGEFNSNPSGPLYAALWTEAGAVFDLNALLQNGAGWQLHEAIAINDRGQIVGYADYSGQTRAFLLTPVPEPASLLCLVTSALGVVALRGRNQVSRGQANR